MRGIRHLSALLCAALLAVSAAASCPADAAWERAMRTCWSAKTSLVYTCPPDKVKPAREFDDGPGYFHWRKGDPVKGTYGKGMGDCALICGTALSGLVDRWAVRPDAATRAAAAKVARGLLNLERLHGRPGFVARGICEEDGRSVCSQSSIDQYTHWVHGLFRYAKSGMADEACLRDWRRAIAEVAAFLQARCTPERNWNFGRFDGSDDPRGICTMWGPSLKAHAVARLPAIYLAAWDATGDRRWRDAYEAIADEALARSQGLADTKALYGTPCYILLQAQCSFEVIAALERDPVRLGKLRAAMRAAAADARRRVGVLARRPEQKFYGMCADGEIALALLMGGDAAGADGEAFVRGVCAKAPVDRTDVCRAAHVLAAYWRFMRRAAGNVL